MSDTVPVRDAIRVSAAAPPALAGERAAGAVLLRGGVFAGLAVGVVVVSGALLVPLGWWRPVPALLLVLAGLAGAWRLSRAVPVQPVPVWATGLSLLAAGGNGVWAALTHGEHIVLRRDAGSYALFAQWIATRHGLPVHADLEAFGGSAALAVPGFSLDSPAYFQVLHGGGAEIVPQFLLGAPAVFSVGWWVDGWNGLLLAPAVVSALGVFAVAGLTARLVGPRWAPLAAGSLALAFPLLFTARSTYSEPVAFVLLITAAALLVDAMPDGPRQRVLGLAGGAVLGLAGLVRVDVLTEVALIVPVIAALALRRHRAAAPIALGVTLAAAVAATVDLLTSMPYLESIEASLLPLGAATGVLVAAGVAVVLLGRWRGWLDGRPLPPQPGALARLVQRAAGPSRWVVTGLVLLLGVLLVTRPLWQTVRALEGEGASFVAGLQRAQSTAVDGARTYAEWSLLWVMWWLGPVLVAAAWATFAVLTGRTVGWLLRRPPEGGSPGEAPAWLIPALVALASSLLTLWRPGITPDHPWADRRLVPVLLPAVVIAATAAVAWAVRRARRRWPATLLTLTTLVAIALMLLPPLLASVPLARDRTEQGELAAVRELCAALRPGDVVVAVDNRGFNEWPQVVRGVCGHPAAGLEDEGSALPDDQLRASVEALATLVSARGGRLVLLTSGDDRAPDEVLTRLGLAPQRVVHLTTTEDARRLVRPPLGTNRLGITVWIAPWPG